MTDYQDLLQTIKSLQHSRLSYIELLQEEVKRSQDVSSDPLMLIHHFLRLVTLCFWDFC